MIIGVIIMGNNCWLEQSPEKLTVSTVSLFLGHRYRGPSSAIIETNWNNFISQNEDVGSKSIFCWGKKWWDRDTCIGMDTFEKKDIRFKFLQILLGHCSNYICHVIIAECFINASDPPNPNHHLSKSSNVILPFVPPPQKKKNIYIQFVVWPAEGP